MKTPAALSFILAAVFGFWIGNRQVININSARGIAADRENYGKPNGEFVNGISDYFSWLPANDQEALREYLALMGKINGKASESIEVRFQELVRGPCFGELATRFYADRFNRDVENLASRLPSRFSNSKLPEVIGLNEESGVGEWASEKPGQVLNDAISAAGGDPHLGLFLLGVCGHDDQVQSRPSLSEDNPNFSDLLRLKRVQLERLRQAAIEQLKRTSDKTQAKKIDSFIESMVKRQSQQNLPELHCLPTSAIYLPKSLGTEIDISEQLKKKIEAAQAPTEGRGVLPAKYYHFIGSAITACLFRSKSKIGSLAAVSNPLAARAYRALRLNEVSDFETTMTVYGVKMNKEFSFMKKLTQEDLTDEFVGGLIKKRMSMPVTGLSQEEAEFFSRPEGELINQAFSKVDRLDQIGVKEVKRRILARWARLDALMLARKWYNSVNIPGLGTLLLPNKTRRPEYDQIRGSAMSGLPPNPFLVSTDKDRCAEPKWSRERCQRAMDTLDSWEVDFEWSQAAHLIGAKFGLSQCRTLQKDETVEQLACLALKKLKPNFLPLGQVPQIAR